MSANWSLEYVWTDGARATQAGLEENEAKLLWKTDLKPARVVVSVLFYACLKGPDGKIIQEFNTSLVGAKDGTPAVHNPAHVEVQSVPDRGRN